MGSLTMNRSGYREKESKGTRRLHLDNLSNLQMGVLRVLSTKGGIGGWGGSEAQSWLTLD